MPSFLALHNLVAGPVGSIGKPGYRWHGCQGAGGHHDASGTSHGGSHPVLREEASERAYHRMEDTGLQGREGS